MLLSKSVMIPQKIKNRNAVPFSNSTTGYLPKENENANLKSYMQPYVFWNIIYNNQSMEATPVSINRWTDKEDVWYTMKHLFSYKKE